MAVAPLNKVEEVVAFAVTQIPPEKLLMGIPLYGYDWRLPYVKDESVAKSISPQEGIELARKYGSSILFDEVSKAPFFNYNNDGIEHEVWFEDGDSIEAKMGLVDKYGLVGVSYWNLIKEFPQNWQVLSGLYNIVKVL